MSHWMIMYNTLKILHIISASILFATGMGTALYMYQAHFQKNLHLRAHLFSQVVFADWVFTTPSGVFQALSAAALIYIRGYQLHQVDYQWHQFWIYGSVIGYVIAGVCWCPVVYLQSKMQFFIQQAAEHGQALSPRLSAVF